MLGDAYRVAIRNDFYVYCVSVFRSQWFNILNRVHRATEEELHGMREESANVKHAVVRRLTLSQFSQEILFSTNVAISRRSVSWNAVQKAAERKMGRSVAWEGVRSSHQAPLSFSLRRFSGLSPTN